MKPEQADGSAACSARPGNRGRRATGTAHPMYSSLFSSVTRMLAPPSFRSCEVTFPRISMSTEKYISKPHSSMLLSLGDKIYIYTH